MLNILLIWVIGAVCYFAATYTFLKLDTKKYGREGLQSEFFFLWIISIPLWYAFVPFIIGFTIWYWCYLFLIKHGFAKEPQQHK